MEPGHQILLNTFLGFLGVALCWAVVYIGIKAISLRTQDSLNYKSFFEYSAETIKATIPCFLLAIMPLMGLTLMLLSIGNTESIGIETQVDESFEIVALKTNEDAIEEKNGSAVGIPFYVSFSTTTTTNDTYTVMKETETGGYKQFSFPVEDTTIFEVADNYRVEKVVDVNRYRHRYFDTDEEFTTNVPNSAEYYLYIPEGSLVLNTYDAGWNGKEGEE